MVTQIISMLYFTVSILHVEIYTIPSNNFSTIFEIGIDPMTVRFHPIEDEIAMSSDLPISKILEKAKREHHL